MGVDTRSRAQWRKAYESARTQVRLLENELKTAHEELTSALDGCIAEHSPGSNPTCSKRPRTGDGMRTPE